MNKKENIASRIAQYLPDGAVVNLGIGIPTLIPNFLPEGRRLNIHSENGALGVDLLADESTFSEGMTDAGGHPIQLKKGGMVFDSAFSFSVVRSGIIDFTILGALEVDAKGNLSNWIVPGKIVPGMGGAMDLVYGAKEVIVAMEHRNKQGQSKIVSDCKFPITGAGVVNKIVTDLAVFSVDKQGLVLEEIMPESNLQLIKEATDTDFRISQRVKEEVTN